MTIQFPTWTPGAASVLGGAARHIAWYVDYQLDRTGTAHTEDSATALRRSTAAALFPQTNR